MLNTLAIAGTITHFGARGFVWFAPLLALLLVAALVVLTVLLVRSRRRLAVGAAPTEGSRAAETTLAERFAQGDIDEVEYRARLEVLRSNRSAPPTA